MKRINLDKVFTEKPKIPRRYTSQEKITLWQSRLQEEYEWIETCLKTMEIWDVNILNVLQIWPEHLKKSLQYRDHTIITLFEAMHRAVFLESLLEQYG